MALRAVLRTIFNSVPPILGSGASSSAQADSVGSLFVNNEGRKATYSAFASFTAAAGDIAVISGIQPAVSPLVVSTSASAVPEIVRVTRVEVSLSTSGTAALEQVQLVIRSTADTGGTSAAMTTVPHDDYFGPAFAAPLSYTVAPTLGTAVGTVRGVQFNDQSAALPGAATWLWTFGDGRAGASAIVLRAKQRQLCVNLGGVVATQTATVSFEWTEE